MRIDSLPWLPPVTVKRHRWARYVKFRLDGGTVLVTIPHRFKISDLPAIFAENKAWILKQLQTMPAATPKVLPDRIDFHAVGESWRVSYESGHSKARVICRPQQEIVVNAPEAHESSRFLMLSRWVRQQARLHLPRQFDAISRQTGLSYQRLTLRNQKTRWGSCSSTQAISLNYKLIFLPSTLALHVMIHELCHTKYMNHSEKFWQLVGSYDPEWEHHRRQLRKADKFIPNWL